MTTRTVRLDPEAETTLAQLRKATGQSISTILKQGLLAYHQRIASTASTTPYAIYRELDLGPGGYSIAASTETRRGVRRAVARKLKR